MSKTVETLGKIPISVIMAAPDMLEALEAISHFPSANISSDWMPIFEQAKAAIRLAKGESQ